MACGRRAAPGVLPVGFILVPPAPQQRLTEAVLAAELGKTLLAADELANDLQFELPAERPFHHARAPRWRSVSFRFPILFDKGTLDYSFSVSQLRGSTQPILGSLQLGGTQRFLCGMQ